MDLLDLMSEGRGEKALDRLEGMLRQYEADGTLDQEQALERAMNFCDLEWGSYQAGMEALARRVEGRTDNPIDGAMQSLRLREEGTEPGTIVRGLRLRRERECRRAEQRKALIARYGSEDAAKQSTPFELLFINAAAILAEESEDGAADPFGPYQGWHLAWHDLPQELRQAVSAAHPLPSTVEAAREECLGWERRREDVGIVFECPGEGSLPTACAARLRVVEELWRDGLAAATLADVQARLDYWAGKGGDDGRGYRVLQADLARLAAQAVLGTATRESTKDKARALKERHPDWSLARIGQALGISRQAVHKHLKAKAA
jgi:hypothetical protein